MKRFGALAGPMVLAAAVLAAGLVAAPAAATGQYQGTVAAAIELLPVAPEDRTGYARSLFPHWLDADGDCQNARQETLLAETLDSVTFSTVRNCTVVTGKWYSYFDDLTFTAASKVSIDHMVPLAEAWDSGARDWTLQLRKDFANDLGDPRSLSAVSLSSNSSKSDSDPSDWLPKFDRCRYVSDWVAVKLRWGLSVDEVELGTLRAESEGCGLQELTVEVVNGELPPPADTTPPSVPANLTAVPTAGSVVLAWDAATDDVGVVEYRLTRDAVAIGATPLTAYTDSAVSPGFSYAYSVIAIDAAGNPSAAATVTVETPVAGLSITGIARTVGRSKYADLSWTGATTRVDLWRGSSRLLRNSAATAYTNQVSRLTTTATFTVCPTGAARTSPDCAAVTLSW